LDPETMREKVAETGVVGLVGFAAPFIGCAALAYYGGSSGNGVGNSFALSLEGRGSG
jgi:hypothetical protein